VIPREEKESMSNDKLIFLSYAKEDLPHVRNIYKLLLKRGLNLWFDEVDLDPGRWITQIRKAITKSRYFVIFLSKAALRKTGDYPGFQDEELNEAYHIAVNQTTAHFTIVPVRLEECGHGDHRVSIFQQYDLFPQTELSQRLDKLSLHLGGHPLNDPNSRDTRTEDEKLELQLLAKAEVFLYANDPEKSKKMIDTVLELNSGSPLAYHLLACVYEV
jgi:hypothetical protein